MKLTDEQAEIVTGYTGTLAMPWGDFHAKAETKLGRPVFTHEFGYPDIWAELKELYKDEFLAICAAK